MSGEDIIKIILIILSLINCIISYLEQKYTAYIWAGLLGVFSVLLLTNLGIINL